MQAHCGDQSAAMLCSSGSKALSIVSPMQAMLCSNGSSKLSARSDPPRQVSLLSNLVLAALAEYEFGITGSSSTRVQAAQRSVRPAHYKVQSPLSVSVGIRSSIDELCGRMRHARAYDFCCSWVACNVCSPRKPCLQVLGAQPCVELFGMLYIFCSL